MPEPLVLGQRWPRSHWGKVPEPGEGEAGGDLTGNYPSPTLVTVVSPGVATKVTVDAKGRVISRATLIASDLPAHTHVISDVTGLQAILNTIPTKQFMLLSDGAANPDVVYGDDLDFVLVEELLP